LKICAIIIHSDTTHRGGRRGWKFSTVNSLLKREFNISTVLTVENLYQQHPPRPDAQRSRPRVCSAPPRTANARPQLATAARCAHALCGKYKNRVFLLNCTIGKPPNVPYKMSAHALCGKYTQSLLLLICTIGKPPNVPYTMSAHALCGEYTHRSWLLPCAVGNGGSSMIIVVVLFELHTRCPSCAPRRVREFTNSSCCSVLKYVAGLLQCFVVCCSVLQCLEKSLARMRCAARDNLTNVL